jgi:hypothetical protein
MYVFLLLLLPGTPKKCSDNYVSARGRLVPRPLEGIGLMGNRSTLAAPLDVP